MKRIIFYCVFCLSGLFLVNTTQADEYNVTLEDICVNLPNGYYANYSNCRWFYFCDNHETRYGMCPNGLVFDVTTSSCNLRSLSITAASYCP